MLIKSSKALNTLVGRVGSTPLFATAAAEGSGRDDDGGLVVVTGEEEGEEDNGGVVFGCVLVVVRPVVVGWDFSSILADDTLKWGNGNELAMEILGVRKNFEGFTVERKEEEKASIWFTLVNNKKKWEGCQEKHGGKIIYNTQVIVIIT